MNPLEADYRFEPEVLQPTPRPLPSDWREGRLFVRSREVRRGWLVMALILAVLAGLGWILGPHPSAPWWSITSLAAGLCLLIGIMGVVWHRLLGARVRCYRHGTPLVVRLLKASADRNQERTQVNIRMTLEYWDTQTQQLRIRDLNQSVPAYMTQRFAEFTMQRGSLLTALTLKGPERDLRLLGLLGLTPRYDYVRIWPWHSYPNPWTLKRAYSRSREHLKSRRRAAMEASAAGHQPEARAPQLWIRQFHVLIATLWITITFRLISDFSLAGETPTYLVSIFLFSIPIALLIWRTFKRDSELGPISAKFSACTTGFVLAFALLTWVNCSDTLSPISTRDVFWGGSFRTRRISLSRYTYRRIEMMRLNESDGTYFNDLPWKSAWIQSMNEWEAGVAVTIPGRLGWPLFRGIYPLSVEPLGSVRPQNAANVVETVDAQGRHQYFRLTLVGETPPQHIFSPRMLDHVRLRLRTRLPKPPPE